MPFVPREFLDISIFLYPSMDDAKAREQWGGSGFLLGLPSDVSDAVTHLYAVTNDHVRIHAPVMRLVTKTGEVELRDAAVDDWIPHPDGDDVAICPLGALADRDFVCTTPGHFIKQDDFSDYYGIGPGDECMMVGRYVNHEGKQFDRPIVRFGNLAMMPEPIRQEKRAFDQESFLVDMRSVSGFSGSPVFVYYESSGPRAKLNKDDPPSLSAIFDPDWSGLIAKSWLLGVDWGNLPARVDMTDSHGNKGQVKVNSTAACVIPAWRLNKLLAEEKIVKPKEEADRKLAQLIEDGVSLDALGKEEFERFDNLARQIVRVPKAEIDEQRKDKGD